MKKTSLTKKIFIGFAAIVALLVLTIIITFLTFNPDTYRPQLVEMLSKQTGRTIKLGGPIKLGFTLRGATLTISDAAISNPSWASRPNMAGIGKFELGIAFLPLLSHELKITELQISNADIQLETGESGKHNWDRTVAQEGKAEAETTSANTNKSVAIQADHVSITDSQVSIRGQDGKVSVFKTKVLTYGVEDGGITIHFNGDYNGAPIALDFKTGTKDLMANTAWPFDADLTYGDYIVGIKGNANLIAKTASISDYTVTAGKSEIHGQMTVNLAGERPSLKGTLVSNELNPADFKPAAAQSDSGESGAPAASESNQVFSDDPLPFDALKSIDAAVQVNLVSLTVGGATLNNVTSKINLNDGHFEAPMKAGFGKSIMGGTVAIDANAKPPQISAAFSAPNVDLAELLAVTKAPAFLTGNANADMAITTSGYSMHNLAGDANGKINIIAAGGDISSSAADGISSSLMALVAPQGNNTLNCLAARFNITNGIVRDNGILLDSAATAIAGKGGFNLGLETIDMVLHARPKIANLGGVLPPLEIGGTFKNPSFHMDAAAIAQNVVGVLTSGGSLDSLSNSNVPDVTGPAGTNACVYTLDHPSVAKSTASSGVLVPGVAGQLQKLKSSAPALLKGLLGQ